MKTIPLTQGKAALVDDEDYEELAKHKWYFNTGAGGYAARNIWRGEHRIVLMHRVILDAEPGQEIDHANGDNLDNRKMNLRFCTRSENNANRHRRGPHSSHFKGVFWHGMARKWMASIGKDYRFIYLGLFDSEEGAARAYDAKARELFGEFANLNFP